jgi:hypothetical protein
VNERQWLNGDDPQAMLRFLGESAGDRKLRLFACACLRELWPWTQERAVRRAVLVAERFADGRATRQELQSAFVVAWPNKWEPVRSAAAAAANAPERCPWQGGRVQELARAAADRVVRCGYGRQKATVGDGRWGALCAAARKAQAELVREVFGNPFRTLSFEPSWLTPTVRAVAQVIYDDQELRDMPVLADALEEAGCDNEAVLNHCRGGGRHRLGCWVVDLALGHSAVSGAPPEGACSGARRSVN